MASRRTNPAPKPRTTVTTRRAPKPEQENVAPPSTTPLNQLALFHEELEQKYNIEGCNTLDIIYAQQENNEAHAQLADQAAKLAAQEKVNNQLRRQLAALQEAQEARTNAPTAAADIRDEEIDGDTTIADALEAERVKNAELQKRLDQLSNTKPITASTEKIPRPAGSAGNTFNIQNEMGLGGSRANRDIYKALMRNVRDLTLQAGINWELPWAQIPASNKASLFDVARARHPILEDYVNDWATEEIVKQYIKNKRRNGYKNNWLEVPEKYAYLKTNSAKRDQSASRKRRTVSTTAPRKTAVAAAAKKATKKSKAAKVKSATVAKTKPAPQTKGKVKGKGRAGAVPDDEDEDDESMIDAGEGSDDEE
ncbi:hypothetical protein B0H17DRAFT_1073443 [Mycena rosella]|uniref:Uncharacterized protein n=1 Tax=Mycena rosella TaxID=1033263 RepID=A0AAD7DBT4_MYCRO|nr:hypothetical protein B0H17DRAFT_1098959 [Mycena rosella]KAJ7683840.1 hypothetical protein B0H17DRAFT_1073443 [Mycena rosella]